MAKKRLFITKKKSFSSLRIHAAKVARLHSTAFRRMRLSRWRAALSNSTQNPAKLCYTPAALKRANFLGIVLVTLNDRPAKLSGFFVGTADLQRRVVVTGTLDGVIRTARIHVVASEAKQPQNNRGSL
jgi:hypothetical protein